MSFESFLSNVFSVFPNILTWCSNILNNLMSNYIFMVIIYMGLIIIIINIIKEIINLILTKTNGNVKDKGD